MVWASLPIKNSSHAYKLKIARKTFLKTFFFGEHLRLCPWPLALATSIPVLGIERVCPRKGCPWPWPRIFFVSLALASSLVSSTPHLLFCLMFIMTSYFFHVKSRYCIAMFSLNRRFCVVKICCCLSDRIILLLVLLKISVALCNMNYSA